MYGAYAKCMPMVFAGGPSPKGAVDSAGVLCGARLVNTENARGIPWAYHGHTMRGARAEWAHVNVCPISKPFMHVAIPLGAK